MADVSDLRRLVARDAQIVVRSLRRRDHANVDASLDYLISRACKSPDVLLDARDLLGEQDAEARALLYRAARLARYPVEPEPPRPSRARTFGRAGKGSRVPALHVVRA